MRAAHPSSRCLRVCEVVTLSWYVAAGWALAVVFGCTLACGSAQEEPEKKSDDGAVAVVQRGPFKSVTYTVSAVDVCSRALNGCLISISIDADTYTLEDNDGEPITSPVTADEWEAYDRLLSSKKFAEKALEPEVWQFGPADDPASTSGPALHLVDDVGTVHRNVLNCGVESEVCELVGLLRASIPRHLTCPATAENLNGFDTRSKRLPVRYACYVCESCRQESP